MGAATLACPASAAGYQVLTGAEADLLDAICDQIVPADRDAGAKQAGCVQYIDRQLAGPLQRYKNAYRQGLAALVKTIDFLHLGFDERKAFLRRMEAGEISGPAWEPVSAATFFNMVLDHTYQGFYGDPKHGGNRDAVSWHMLGIAEHMHG
ncbi:MAG TPA: gluconate 2-dehydrogenase subunit 3 family protein [Candidatus Sulfotelmatobacter sp.]|nr:gluconate 2-dehydrogenase subunit 3 family protein [Candidatus Sulfotelmatobacter sp.]